MGPSVILHDQRLDGAIDSGVHPVIRVDETTPLVDAFRQVVAAVTRSGSDLIIACHGFMTHEYGEASNLAPWGGQGLQLCSETLRVRNISAVAPLRGHFQTIWLMACGPAGTFVHPSRPFCREFAFHADAVVIASDTAQQYHAGEYDNARAVSRRALRFGAWEGSVFAFRPDGTVRPYTKDVRPLP